MSIKKTTNDFITKARQIHGDKYDYSLTEYAKAYLPIRIICPIHGEFTQKPRTHLLGCGCPTCGSITKAKNKRSHRTQIGIVDIEEYVCNDKSYGVWKDMLRRCYSRGANLRWNSYKDCSVCEEWMYYSNFKKWFDEHYVDGWHLDKDLIIAGNRVYSPTTCCFIPREINVLFKKTQRANNMPKGVKYHHNRYYASIQCNSKHHYLGSFDTIEDAVSAVKSKQREYLLELAERYRNLLADNVYQILLNECIIY